MSPVAATWPEGLAAGRNDAFPSVCGRSSGQCGVCLVCREWRSEGLVAPSGVCVLRKGTGSRLFGNRKASRIGSRFVREPQGFENWLSFYSRTGRLRELALVLFENWNRWEVFVCSGFVGRGVKGDRSELPRAVGCRARRRRVACRRQSAKCGRKLRGVDVGDRVA